MEMHLDGSKILLWTEYLWMWLTAIWMGSAPFVKKTLYRQTEASRLAHVAVLAAGLYLLFGWPSGIPWLERPLYAVTVPIAMLGLVLAAAGTAFAVWARLILGENWSGVATLKQDHNLVRRGPYAIVRHPIYTGLLTALLGTALEHGLVRSLLSLGILCAGLWLKMRVEERILTERFGAEYEQYRREVPALAPWRLR